MPFVSVLNHRNHFVAIVCALALGLGGTVLLPTSASARGLDDSGRGAVIANQLSMISLQQATAIARQAQAQGIKINDFFDYQNKTRSLTHLANNAEGTGGMQAILMHQDMDAREFLLIVLAARQVALHDGTQAETTAKLLGLPSAANQAFYQAHQKEVLTLLALCSGEAESVAGTPYDNQAAAATTTPDTKVNCTGLALTLDPANYAFRHAVTASHGPQPPAKGTFERIAKTYAALSANMDNPTAKTALATMAHEVKAQEGASPAQATHDFRAAQASLNNWLGEHCH